MATDLFLPAPPLDLVELIRKAETGCQESATILYERCREPLLVVIRQFLSPTLRRIHDSDDFLEVTFAKVFSHHIEEEVLASPQTLWRYLATVAKNKVLDAHRRFVKCERRSLLREVFIEDLDAEEWLLSSETAPDDFLCLKDFVANWWEVVVKQLPPVYQYIIRRCSEGSCVDAIARQLGISIRTVERVLARLEDLLRDSWRQ